MSRKPRQQRKFQGSTTPVLQPLVAQPSKGLLNGQPPTIQQSNGQQKEVLIALTMLLLVVCGVLWVIQPPWYISFASLLTLILGGFLFLGYTPGGSKVTGFVEENEQGKKQPKTLWNWLELLIIPIVIAGATIGFSIRQDQANIDFNQQQHQIDLKIAADNRQNDLEIADVQQKENVLISYEKDISDLLISYKLGSPQEITSVRIVARAKTLTALRQLDPLRKAFLIQFLYEAQLIKVNRPNDNNPIIPLRDADLSGMTLSSSTGLRQINVYANPDPNGVNHCNLNHIDLSGADLTKADLGNADLSSANLEGTYFYQAKLSGADLSHANLRGADLRGADLSMANLDYAQITGATMPND